MGTAERSARCHPIDLDRLEQRYTLGTPAHRDVCGAIGEIRSLRARVAELERRNACESCGADRGAELCHGCGKTVCLSCVDVFDHWKDGEHGSGDPPEEVRRLRAALSRACNGDQKRVEELMKEGAKT